MTGEWEIYNVISASTHRYVNYFISKSWWWLINRNVNVDFTSWYIHLFGLYFFPATFILSDFIHIYFHIYIYIYIYTRIIKCFQTFFVLALLLIVHTWNSSPLPSNLLRLQCTCSTVPTTSARPHGSPLVWACQWPSSQPPSSPHLSHNDSL